MGIKELARNFKLTSPYGPAGDQENAIKSLTEGILSGEHYQTLQGVTGSGKTFTMANIIENVQKPTLILSHNKTLAAQLYREMTDLFPENAVEYFVSYYNYYQPEAYVPSRDLYIEKDSSINDEIDRMRLSTTASLMERKDVIVVSTVSCIYGLGNPASFQEMKVVLETGRENHTEPIIKKLITLQYERNDAVPGRGHFRLRGDVLEIYPAYLKIGYRIEFEWDIIERIVKINPVSGEVLEVLNYVTIYPAKHFVMPEDQIKISLDVIRKEMEDTLGNMEAAGKLVEAQRLRSRTEYDLEMMQEMGHCPGIENYSRHLSGRKQGERPGVLMDYFPKDFLFFVDESHVTLSQVRAMYEGDRARKLNLVNFGFRLPSALDNRPLQYQEFEKIIPQTIFVSATPGKEEAAKSTNRVEQLIRPTGLLDPPITVRPTEGQIENLYGEIRKCIKENNRILITTLTKKMAEDLTDYLTSLDLKVRYLHSEIETIERVEILRDLRAGEFDVLVGINLLREGLDLPEVALIAIMDADKIGFLRSATSLIQIIGRAARNAEGRVIMYADRESDAMKTAIEETIRRRILQQAYNDEHGITPTTIKKAVQNILNRKKEDKKKAENISLDMLKKAYNILIPDQKKKLIKTMEKHMFEHAKNMEFEEAAIVRDEIRRINGEID